MIHFCVLCKEAFCCRDSITENISTQAAFEVGIDLFYLEMSENCIPGNVVGLMHEGSESRYSYL